jgi:hypothetical protein
MKKAIAMAKAIRARASSEMTVFSSDSRTITSTIATMIRNPRSVGFMSAKKRFIPR